MQQSSKITRELNSCLSRLLISRMREKIDRTQYEQAIVELVQEHRLQEK